MLLTVYGTEWPILCWCAVKKLLTHSLTLSLTHRSRQVEYVRYHANMCWQRSWKWVLSVLNVISTAKAEYEYSTHLTKLSGVGFCSARSSFTFDYQGRRGFTGCTWTLPLHIKHENFLLGIKSKNASSLLLCLPIFPYHVMILYVLLIPTCEPLLNFLWIRPWLLLNILCCLETAAYASRFILLVK